MISGIRISWLALLFVLPPLAAAAQWDAAQLLAELARTVPKRIAYSETRRMAYLDVPLGSAGVLEFRPPDLLRRSVEGNGENYVIVGDVVRIETSDGSREIALDVHPALRAFAESLRATLAGDLPRLQRHFHVALAGDKAHWRLSLRPRDADVAVLIEDIELSGTHAHLLRVETRESGGDIAIMELKDGQ
ncbi:LolA-related protein [Sulfurivermis fontis]|uniref:LolA-related protein n=1 Tax=Sulfurivermis fontis TaxID=1972068 RepID=UPI000FD74998|nr:LolA-related protein [Sulfurivermis fontis]